MNNTTNLDIESLTHEELKQKYIILKKELDEKNSMLQLVYNEMEIKEEESQHYKELFSAANTNLLSMDEKTHILNNKYKSAITDNQPLKDKITNLETEYTTLKEMYDLNINNENNTVTTNTNNNKNINNVNNVGGVIGVKDILLINEIEDWLLDYINVGCTFVKMKKHKFTITTNKNKKEIKKRSARNTRWTLRILIKLLLTHYNYSSVIKNIKDNKIDIDNPNLCTLCLDEAKDPCVLSCSCKYVYCCECIDEWAKHKGCPACKKNVCLIENGLLSPYHINQKNPPMHLKIFE